MAIESREDLLIDLKTLNEMQVNERARQMLVEIGIEPDPAIMYCVQLAKWGYKKGGIEVEDSTAETVDAMPLWRPARIANFFIESTKGEGYSPTGWQEAKKPLALARIILDDIEEKMMQHFPWYRSL